VLIYSVLIYSVLIYSVLIYSVRIYPQQTPSTDSIGRDRRFRRKTPSADR
jgi:hypothetical protein